MQKNANYKMSQYFIKIKQISYVNNEKYSNHTKKKNLMNKVFLFLQIFPERDLFYGHDEVESQRKSQDLIKT